MLAMSHTVMNWYVSVAPTKPVAGDVLRATKFHAECADFRMKSRCALPVALVGAEGDGILRDSVSWVARSLTLSWTLLRSLREGLNAAAVEEADCSGEFARQGLYAAERQVTSTAKAGERRKFRGSVIEAGQR